MNPLHATIEEFAAEGYTHIECHCPRCRMIRLRPISWLPRMSLGPTIAQLSARLRCANALDLIFLQDAFRRVDMCAVPRTSGMLRFCCRRAETDLFLRPALHRAGLPPLCRFCSTQKRSGLPRLVA